MPTTLTAEVTNDAGETLAAKIHDLSPGGLMLEGDQALKTLIYSHHDLDRDPLFYPSEFEIRIKLPDQQKTLFCRVRLLYIRRLAQYHYNIGFRYVAISSMQVRMLERHIFGEEATRDTAKGPLDTSKAINFQHAQD
jgi:hypothetical protein